MTSPSHPVQAILANKQGQLPGAALLRALVSHETWHLPGRAERGRVRPLTQRTTDGDWLSLFTSRDAMDVYEAANGKGSLGESWVVSPGSGLFMGLSGTMAGVDIDPDSPHAIHYRAHQFATLRRWGRTIEVEKLLAGASQQSLRLLRDHDAYWIVMVELPDGRSQLAMAPDERGRKLAAVVTARDTLDAFLRGAAKALPAGASALELRGGDLFGRLAGMPLDGIVFNCSGPVPPRAVAQQLAQLVLQD